MSTVMCSNGHGRVDGYYNRDIGLACELCDARATEYDVTCLECGQVVKYRNGAWICPTHRDRGHIRFEPRPSPASTATGHGGNLDASPASTGTSNAAPEVGNPTTSAVECGVDDGRKAPERKEQA